MPKYNILVEETLSRTVEVTAKNSREAVEKVSARYEAEKIVLDSSDLSDTEIYDMATE